MFDFFGNLEPARGKLQTARVLAARSKPEGELPGGERLARPPADLASDLQPDGRILWYRQ